MKWECVLDIAGNSHQPNAIRHSGTRSARVLRRTVERDDTVDLQRVLAHDNARDQQLQDRLFVGKVASYSRLRTHAQKAVRLRR